MEKPDAERTIKGLRCMADPNCGERECDGCSYDNAGCFLDVASDALKLLEPRLMTVDEVKQMGLENCHRNDEPIKTCVIEYRNSKRLHTTSPEWNEAQFDGDDSPLEIQFLFMGTDEYDNYFIERYGQVIRCWTARPTDKQRRVTPWGN